MRTILTAAVAALLAAAITATAANQGDPVHDKAAVKQLKKLNQSISQTNETLGRRYDNTLETKTMMDWLREIEQNTNDTCRAVSQYSYSCH